MIGSIEVRKLTGEQLLTLMVASERRNRESRDGGSTAPVASFPACAVCDAAVDSQNTTLGLSDDGERILTVGPCGHRMSYHLKVAEQLVARVQQIVDEEEKPVSVWGTIFSLEEDPPYEYQRSHILPSEADARGGDVQLAEIPSHITRDGRDDQPEDGRPWPWLRVSLNSEDAVLHRRQVRQMWESMGAWLQEADPAGAPTSADVEASEGRQ